MELQNDKEGTSIFDISCSTFCGSEILLNPGIGDIEKYQSSRTINFWPKATQQTQSDVNS